MPAIGEAVQPLYVATEAVQIAASGDETSLMSGGVGQCSIGGGRMRVGDTVNVLASGKVSVGPIPPPLVLRFKLNGTSILETPAVALPPECFDNPWRFEVAFGCQIDGEHGVGVGIRIFTYLQAPRVPLTWLLIQRDPTPLDTRSACMLDVAAQWLTADPQAVLTCEELTVTLQHIPLGASIHMP